MAPIPSSSPETPPSTKLLGEHWAPIELPGSGVTVYDGVHGDSGFVLVGSLCGPDTDCSPETAAAWFQVDGQTWERATVADAEHAQMTDVAYNGAYFAAGTRLEPSGGGYLVTGVLWRSDDGRDWASVGSLDLGDCDDENGCPRLGQFEVSQAGFMLAKWTDGVTDIQNGLYRSTAGRRWTRVDPRLVGRTTRNADVTGSIAFDDALVLAWPTPNGESSDLWTTKDGKAWSKIGRSPVFSPSLTTDGSRIVAAGLVCPGDECQTRVWSNGSEGSFQPVGEPFSTLTDVHIAFAGISGFVLVGSTDDHLVFLASPDAATWAERSPDLDLAGCDIRHAVSGPSSVILVSEYCRRAWFSHG